MRHNLIVPAPKILHVTQPVTGGIPRVLADQARMLASAGQRVAAACPRGPLTDDLRGHGVEHLPFEPAANVGAAAHTEAGALRAIVDDWCPDVVHLHGPKAGFVGRLALRGSVPTVYQPHVWPFDALGSGLRGVSRGWERRAARWSHATVCVSFAERDRGIAAGIRANWFVMPNRVDLAVWRPGDRAAARARLGLATHLPLAVCVARLHPAKGQDVLLHAWPQVRARVPEARLALVGEGPERERLGALADESVGFADASAEVRDWYAAADVVVAPSWREGMPMVPLEAQASGRALVASDIPGIAESIAPGGRLVPPGDVAALADQVAVALGDLGETHRRGHQARDAAERHATFDDLLVELDVVYADATSRVSH